MILEYKIANTIRYDNAVTSVVGNDGKVMVFTEDYKGHHKYLIDDKYIRRYELTTSFYRVFPVQSWRVIAE